MQGRAASIQADLFALGVMLYQLVAGALKPIAPGWQRDVDDELLAADIAALVDGDPTRRPASAAVVARALRALPQRRSALTAERAAVAESARLQQQLARSQRRRRWALGAAIALGAVAALVGYAGWTARTARIEADTRRTQAERLLGFVLSDLRDKLKQAGRLELLDGVGAAALDYFRALPSERLSDDELALRSQALYQLGDVRVSQGDFDGAASAMHQSLQLARELAQREPNDEDRLFALGQSEYWVGYVAMRKRDYAAAQPAFERYLAIAQELAAREPLREEWRRELGYARSNLGSVLERRGDSVAAPIHFRAAHAITQQRFEQAPTDVGAAIDLAISHEKLARVLEHAGNLPYALEHSRAALALSNATAAKDPKDVTARHRSTRNRHYVARLFDFIGDSETALTEQQRVADEMRALSASDPDNMRWKRELVIALSREADLLLDVGRRAEAEHAVVRVRQLLPSVRDPLVEADALVTVGRVALATQNAEQASTDITAAEQTLQPLLTGADAPRAARLMAELHYLRWQQLQTDDQTLAQRNARRSLEFLDAASDDPRSRELRTVLLTLTGRAEEARTVAEGLLASGYRRASFAELCRSLSIAMP